MKKQLFFITDIEVELSRVEKAKKNLPGKKQAIK
jgi:hypothetical protein